MINNYAPQSGRVIKENGNIVNWADSFDTSGNLKISAGANTPQSGTVTIANGASLSGSADLAGLTLIGIIMPSAWTAADITLQASLNNTDFFNVFDVFGSEILIKADASRFIPLSPSDYVGVRYLKVRSGTSGTAVNQGASRTITLVYRAV